MVPSPPITVAQALREAQAVRASAPGLDRLDAQLLLCSVLEKGRAWLIAHDTDVLPEAAAQQYRQLVQRRRHGEPLAYIVGQKEFHGLMLHVGPGVLVPRPDTEVLVDWALDLIEAHAMKHILDLGTGSGAIALAMKAQRPDCEVWAVERSPSALAQAKDNGQRLQLDIHWCQGDWFSALAPEQPLPLFDLIVSNPPYIDPEDDHLDQLTHEPLEALAAAAHGLSDLRHLIAQAPLHLRPQGWLLLEHGWDQAEAVRQAFSNQGWTAISTHRDLAQHERCTGACHVG